MEKSRLVFNPLTNIVLTVLGLLIFPLSSVAGWMKTYGDADFNSGYSVKQTKDGGYIVAGTCLLKTDPLGEIQWSKTYKDSKAYGGKGLSVIQTTDEGYTLVGSCAGGWQTVHLWLIKTNPYGDTLWTQAIGNNSGFSYGECVIETADGYAATGTPWTIMKFDKNGDTVWTHQYGLEGLCIAKTEDNGFIVTGRDSAFHLGVVKTDDKGNLLWAKSHGLSTEGEKGYSIHQTEGGYYVAGWKNGGQALWILKLDELGDTVWSFARDSLQAYDCDETYDGGLAATGIFRTDHGTFLLLLKLDKNGNFQWTKQFGENSWNRGFSVQETQDKGFIITGEVMTSESGIYKICLIKTDSLGNVGVAEKPAVEQITAWQLLSPIGKEIVLQYSGHPSGFQADVYDASGRKVDKIKPSQTQGTFKWGKGHEAGVYFIVPDVDPCRICKVIIVK